MFGTHVWRRDPPSARRRNKESLLNSPLTIKSSTPVFHGIISLLRIVAVSQGARQGPEPVRLGLSERNIPVSSEGREVASDTSGRSEAKGPFLDTEGDVMG